MAIYHLSCQIIGRVNKKTGNTRSSIACAAYRSGEVLKDSQTNEVKKYNRRVAPKTFLLVPEGSPEWAKNREILWNKIEQSEKAYNAQLAREFNIALPVELSVEEQDRLAVEYCQDNFVSKGMIADISIHRDNENNPHFHVMLPMREAYENGFKPKCLKEYILDENGNKIKNKNGTYKSRRVDLNDWNKRENMIAWRENWELKANEYLKKNGINERITCKSYAELGSEKIATLHEGVQVNAMEKAGISTEIRAKNKNIKTYNQCVVELDKYKKLREKKHFSSIKRYFDKNDIETLRQISKYTKTYINYENIEKRRKQLNKWKKSLRFVSDFGTIEKINRIQKEEEYLIGAEAILMHEANIFVEKNYPGMKYHLTPEEKMELVNLCVENDCIFSVDELKEKINDIRDKMLHNELKNIISVKRQYAFYIRKQIENLEDYIGATIRKYGADTSKPETIKLIPADKLEKIRKMNGRIHELNHALSLIDKIYDIEIERMYPDWKERDRLDMFGKEIFLASEKYYGYRLEPGKIMSGSLDQKYNTDIQKDIIERLEKMNVSEYKDFNRIYSDFELDSPVFKFVFYTECMSNPELDEQYKEKIEKLVMPSIYLPKEYRPVTVNNSNGNSIFARTLIRIINETSNDDAEREKKRETEQRKKHGKYSKKHRRLS